MTLKIGITGGIGSGKSTVSKIFELLGIPVFEADAEAKILLDTSAEIKIALIGLFGESIYKADGKVDRKKLAQIIFNDEAALERVNKLVHPAVRITFENWAHQQNTAYVIHEAAILFESGFHRMMDFTLLISAPEEMRIARVVQRDGTSEGQVRQRMAKQWPEAEKQRLASKILMNDNTRLLIPQIIEIDKNLKEYGKIW